MLALIGNIALPELLVIGALAVIIFGRRLPEVAARAYANVRRMRIKLEELRRETGIDDELRKIERSVHEVTRIDVPELSDPSAPPKFPIVPRQRAPKAAPPIEEDSSAEDSSEESFGEEETEVKPAVDPESDPVPGSPGGVQDRREPLD